MTDDIFGKEGTCVLCGGEYSRWGNNPVPCAYVGRCCDLCNDSKVIPARIRSVMEERRESDGTSSSSNK